MILSTNEIRKRSEGLDFAEKLNLKEKVMERNSQVLDLTDVQVNGTASFDDGLYLLTYKLTYTITLPSSRSMEAVVLNQTEDVTEVFVAAADATSKAELIEESLAMLLETDTIDLEESALDNILLSIPMRVLTEAEEGSDTLPSGNSWSVMTEEQYQELQAEKKKEANPFASLEGMFED